MDDPSPNILQICLLAIALVPLVILDDWLRSLSLHGAIVCCKSTKTVSKNALISEQCFVELVLVSQAALQIRCDIIWTRLFPLWFRKKKEKNRVCFSATTNHSGSFFQNQTVLMYAFKLCKSVDRKGWSFFEVWNYLIMVSGIKLESFQSLSYVKKKKS